jgi:N-acetylmuramic acid 6-phosphate etherase
MDYKEAARNFIENEKQFHLGVIPTEQSNPLTRGFSQITAGDTGEGVRTLLKADSRISQVALAGFRSPEFKLMVKEMRRAMDERRTILFSSVGASGRLALQLDATWRRFFTELIPLFPLRARELLELRECSNSIMTGGDRAVVRSVENFEDYMTFGARQIKDAGVGVGDVAIVLSECGLSASVNGSAIEADNQGCATFYLFCNPQDILCSHLERARAVFARENIVKIPLYVGNMAIAGSTRMQVTTVELLVAGAAQELAIDSWIRDHFTDDERSMLPAARGSAPPSALTPEGYAAAFDNLLAQLADGDALDGLSKAIELESATYSRGGLITYSTHAYLQDILTDTTERQPTFTLPPFRKSNDPTAPISWAYAKDPTVPSSQAWRQILHRPVKGLEWTREDYSSMGAAQEIINNPPAVAGTELDYYRVGWEADPSRYERRPALLISLDINGSYTLEAPRRRQPDADSYDERLLLRIGDVGEERLADSELRIPVKLPHTPLELSAHLMIKLIFNILSTATMAKMGRVWSNWMIQVLPTNKKLIDRSTRIIAELANIPYERACEEFYKSYLGRKPGEEYRESYVVETLRRLGVEYK